MKSLQIYITLAWEKIESIVIFLCGSYPVDKKIDSISNRSQLIKIGILNVFTALFTTFCFTTFLDKTYTNLILLCLLFILICLLNRFIYSLIFLSIKQEYSSPKKWLVTNINFIFLFFEFLIILVNTNALIHIMFKDEIRNTSYQNVADNKLIINDQNVKINNIDSLNKELKELKRINNYLQLNTKQITFALDSLEKSINQTSNLITQTKHQLQILNSNAISPHDTIGRSEKIKIFTKYIQYKLF